MPAQIKKNNKLIFGVGFLGEGITLDNAFALKVYPCWHNMLARCYYSPRSIKNKTYVGCTVHSIWFDFQNFYGFYAKFNPHGDLVLDKDILVRNNKVYGPKTCCFVPNNINIMLANIRNNKKFTGVTKLPGGTYRAKLAIGGKQTNIGCFPSKRLAIDAYIASKQEHLLKLIKLHKDVLPKRVQTALKLYRF